jgi:trans-2,3-dihydro-3-hydroxyanthranilate isomerase
MPSHGLYESQKLDIKAEGHRRLFLFFRNISTATINIRKNNKERARTMRNVTFYLVDVFAEEKFAGNQLAVIRGVGSLSTMEMQKIANEMHFSETSFIISEQEKNGGYDVRIFTPSREVPFAGHPTLGTAYILKHLVENGARSKVILNLKIGQISVTFVKDEKGNEIGWMKQKAPVFGKTYPASGVSRVLNLDAGDFADYPVQEVSTGLPFIIVPLKSLHAIKRARVNLNQLLLSKIQTGILVFCPETYKKENNLNVRVFADAYGITEDPATGSGNGCLAGYLSKYEYFGSPQVDTRVEQGFEIDRPSLLQLKAENKEGKIDVDVGGKVVKVAQGQFA